MITNSRSDSAELLRVENLTVDFVGNQVSRALDGVSLSIKRSEICGMIGESGAGKTSLGLAILGLLPRSARISCGTMVWNGKRVDMLDNRSLASLRGHHITMILQEARSSLNPVYTIGEQLLWRLERQTYIENKDHAKQVAIQRLRDVQLDSPLLIYSKYPHELSGGMCQRALIAMALSTQPLLLIADEPTTGLDLINQAAILSLLKRLSSKTSILLITHDLAAASTICDRICILHQHRIIEEAATADFFCNPQTQFSRDLIASIPRLPNGRP